jgi:hypothetical protein
MLLDLPVDLLVATTGERGRWPIFRRNVDHHHRTAAQRSRRFSCLGPMGAASGRREAGGTWDAAPTPFSDERVNATINLAAIERDHGAIATAQAAGVVRLAVATASEVLLLLRAAGFAPASPARSPSAA